MNAAVEQVESLEQLIDRARGLQATGELSQARRLFEESLEKARVLNDKCVEADLLRWIGTIHRHLGEIHRAVECYEESLAIAEAAGSDSGMASALNCLG